ncbi:LCP family protein [Robertmurraya korlensis]|uniref:LCP family protein n=1 Tax=Robertmurraya korlensis TaxID=519977 RepID=UPI00203D69AA|nr:LCP family protein [Robertmurraya korlensis]MCM3599925.1 LCP family protein [Robertmurraya korlensis]
MRRMMAVFLIFLLAGCGYYSSKENIENNQPNMKNKTVENTSEEMPVKRFRPFQSYKKDVNVLLLGVDSRGESSSRSDTIMLAKYEPLNKKVKLVSLMRDSYVTIPGHDKSKLNHAYFYGGDKLLKETIEKNFNVKIDHVALIDFQGFIEVVNILAPQGLKVNVSKPMMKDLRISGEPGMHVLKGQQLLDYVRFRHDAMSDFGRVKRQQDVIISLKDQAVETLGSFDGIVKLPEILTEVANHMDTDIALKDYLTLGATFILNPVSNVETLRVPVENSYTNKYTKHAGEVLNMDMQRNKDTISEFLLKEVSE